MIQGTKGQKSNVYIRIYDLGDRNNMRKEQIWLFFSQIVRIPNGVMDCGISEIENL